MAEETPELPIAEEPKKEAKAEPKENVDDLIAELRNAGVENATQLQGKLDASAQAGKAFQMLGDERERNRVLQTELDKARTQPVQPPSYENFDMPTDRPVDIEAMVERGIDKTLSKREAAQRQAHEASIQAYNVITSDRNFHLVKEAWEEKIKNPAYIYQVQSGNVNALNDYQSMVVDYYQDIAKRSLDTITSMQGGGQVPAPHVESGETRSPNLVTEGAGDMPESIKRLEELKAKVAKGYVPTEDELVDMVDSVAFAPIVEG